MKFQFMLLILLGALLLVSLFIGINIGYAQISYSEIRDILLYKASILDSIDHIKNSTIDIIVFIRTPRLILATLVGASLAVSGVVMQAIIRNPLGDPYTLGISSGASLGATLAIVLGVGKSFGFQFVGMMAFIFAFIVILVVIVIANVGGRATSTKLILAGIAISTISSSFSNLMIYTSSNREASREVSFWLLGSLSGAKWEDIKFIAPIIICLSIFFITQFRTLNLMLLGDEVAMTLGIDMNRIRHLYILIVAALVGFVVYVSGVIGFVGLIVPHICRFIVGTEHKKLIPYSMVVGSLLVVWADILSRSIIPGGEIPTGVIISIVGAPVFIYLIINKSFK